MATKKTTKGSAPVGSLTKDQSVALQSANGNGTAAIPSDGMVQGDAYNPIHQVDNLKDFHKEAERLRGEGYTEVPGFLGGGRGGKLGIDYADYINAKLACDATAGAAGKGQLPLLHVSSGYAQPVTDLITGMGPKPMYQYSQYVGGNLLNKQISYEFAGTLLKGWKIDLLRQINDLKKDSVSSGSPAGNNGTITINDRVLGGSATEEVSEYEQALRDRLAEIEADLAVWEQTMKELNGDPKATNPAEQVGFLGRNNLLQTFQQLYADMLQFNICFPEIELQQTYIDPDTQHEVKSFKWNPKVVGIRWRNAKTMRLEQMDSQNNINYVYISNQWLSSPEQTIPAQDSDFKIDAMPALNPQSPSADLELRQPTSNELLETPDKLMLAKSVDPLM